MTTVKKAKKAVKGMTEDPEVGTVYQGTVKRIMDFGAFVNFIGNKDGLVHVSEIAQHRVEKVTDVLQEGDKVKVMCMGIDNRGKIKLSMKRVNQETGEAIPVEEKPHKSGKHKHHEENAE